VVQVAFHFNVVDVVEYTCRLARKALGRQARLVICAAPDVLQRIDRQLWTLHSLSFLPHASVQASPRVTERSPVWLCTHLSGDEPPDVLVNLLPHTPEGYERFNRLIDIVSLREGDRIAARARWRGHCANGQTPDRFDLGASSA
jgi:DNA polymerase-3 subunit chi